MIAGVGREWRSAEATCAAPPPPPPPPQTVAHYQHIIDDVVARVKPEFVQEGVDE